MVSGQSDVSLLGTVWSDQSVNVLNIDFVQFLNSSLDLVLVSLNGDLQNQGVTVLNLLDGGLRGNWRLNNLVSVQSVVVWDRLSGVSWGSSQLQGLWQSEGGRGSDLNNLLRVSTLQSRFLSSSSLSVWRWLVRVKKKKNRIHSSNIALTDIINLFLEWISRYIYSVPVSRTFIVLGGRGENIVNVKCQDNVRSLE